LRKYRIQIILDMNLLFKHRACCYLVTVCLSVFSLICHGQDIEEEKKAKKEGRPVKIMYFQSPAGAPENTFIYAAGKSIAETDLPKHNFSDTFRIPDGDTQLNFLPEQKEFEQDILNAAPSVKIPKGWKKILLLVIEDKKNNVMPISVKAINASENEFGGGSIYFINLSKVGVFGKGGGKEIRLRPRSQKILKNPINKNGFYPTILKMAVPKEKDPRRFIKQMWGHDKAMRKVLFIIPKPAPLLATYYCAPIRDF